MAVIDGMLTQLDTYTEDANSVKEMVIGRLLTDKVITEEQAKEYTEKWQVIVIKTGWFKRWKEVFNKGSKSDYIYKFVKFED